MKINIKSTILLFLLLFGVVSTVDACTTVIVSGKYTIDGRPLMLKQRDTSFLENKVVTFTDGKYNFVGVVNTKDSTNSEVWGGHNSVGFAIMNSNSYNINQEGAVDDKQERSGQLMKLALQTCKTLSDFETLLETLPRPLYLSSNFGVIDAHGGAAYYETNNDGYVKFDVNDRGQAPLGYLIRTNFSFSGDRSRDKGLSRYNAATELLYYASMTNNLSYDYLFNNVSRSLLHGITQVDLLKQDVPLSSIPQFVAFRDYIPRYLTASVIVTQGVKENESPTLTTSWITLGFPLVTPTVPIVLDDDLLPSVLAADDKGRSKLNDWSLDIKKQLFPIKKGEGDDYLDISKLISADKKGLYFQFQPVNKTVLDKSNEYLNKWHQNNKIDRAELRQFYKWVDEYLTKVYTAQ